MFIVFFVELNLDLVEVDSLSFFVLVDNNRLLRGCCWLSLRDYCGSEADVPGVGGAVGGNLVFVESFVNTEDPGLPQTG